jgi:hypothetical protein
LTASVETDIKHPKKKLKEPTGIVPVKFKIMPGESHPGLRRGWLFLCLNGFAKSRLQSRYPYDVPEVTIKLSVIYAGNQILNHEAHEDHETKHERLAGPSSCPS